MSETRQTPYKSFNIWQRQTDYCLLYCHHTLVKKPATAANSLDTAAHLGLFQGHLIQHPSLQKGILFYILLPSASFPVDALAFHLIRASAGNKLKGTNNELVSVADNPLPILDHLTSTQTFETVLLFS